MSSNNNSFSSTGSIPLGKSSGILSPLKKSGGLLAKFGSNAKGSDWAQPQGQSAQQYHQSKQSQLGNQNNGGYGVLSPTSPPQTGAGSIKSHVTTNSDGSSTAVNYHPTTSSTENSGMVGGNTQPSSSPSNSGLIPNQQPGQPGYYQNELTNIQNAYAPAIAAPAGMNVAQGYGQTLSDYEVAREKTAEAAPALGLQSSQPQAFGYGSNVVNPLTGQSYGAGGAGQGGAFSGGQVMEQQKQGGDYQSMLGAQQQAQSLASNLSTLIKQANINPANAGPFTTYINGINQWINNKSGNPQYQNAANLISEVASKYSNILNQSGGTPTDVSDTTHAIINGLASGKSIDQVLSTLDKNATDSINALKNAGQGNQGSRGTTFGDFY